MIMIDDGDNHGDGVRNKMVIMMVMSGWRRMVYHHSSAK